VKWLRLLVGGVSPRRPGFEPNPIHVGIVGCTKWHRDRYFSEYFGFTLLVLFFQRSARLNKTTLNIKIRAPNLGSFNKTYEINIKKGSDIVVLGLFALSQKVIINFVMSFISSVTLSS